MTSAHDDLPTGLWEAVWTSDLRDRSASHPGGTVLGPVDPEDTAHVLTRHLSGALRTALTGLGAEDQRALAGQVLALLDRAGAAPVVDEKGRVQELYEVTAPGGLATGRLPRPSTPLSDAALLTNARGAPALGAELRRELASADRVDLLCAFLKWSGLRLLDAELRALHDRGVPLRVITTTYMGATERRAVDALVRDYGAEVKVIYETTRTRLHAKAWIFHRATGYDTAYVGSSNLSYSALVEGLEWNVRLSGVSTPAPLATFEATFASYWDNPAFLTYRPDVDGQRLDDALREAGGARRAGAPVDMSSIEVTARPHQQEMLDQLAAERQLHDRHRNLVVAATGTGKTVLAALDYRELCRQHGRRLSLLFVAHRREILQQAQLTYRQVLGDGEFGELLVAGERPRSGRHVFASVQSLSRERLLGVGPDAFDVVVLDECHHAPADSYRRVVERLRPVELLGLTATPERADGADVLAMFGGRTATELRLWDALADDLLVPFHYFGLNDDVDLTAVRWTRGRYDTAGLEGLFTGNDARARVVLRELERRVGDVHGMRALGFCVSVAHAQYMARVFREAGIAAEAVSGETAADVRADSLRRLKAGELNVLFAVDLFNEGVDIPEVDTVLFLRPTESATIFLQQLGRGLRTAHGKAVLTALDFVGHQHEDFRFDERFHALTGVPRGKLVDAVEKDFPFLPAGCSIVLDRVVQDRVLTNLRRQLNPRTPALVSEVRAHGSRDLAGFLGHTGRTLRDVVKGDRSWTALCRVAGLDVPAAGAAESVLLKRVAAVGHVDDRSRAEAYRQVLDGEVSAVEERFAAMLAASLWPSRTPADARAALAALADDEAVREEMRQVVDIAYDSARHPTVELTGSLAHLPFAVHARYSRDEIVSGLGLVTPKRPPVQFREGVVWSEEHQTDALLVTLAKSEAEYSPTTMYRDYPITRELFHWESQSRTTLASATGQRYVHHRERGTHVVLFARQAKTGELGTEPYLFLGPVDHVSHVGEKPIAITWRLRHLMPTDFYAEAAVVAAG
ncbi:DUF3427 domain-containing protein [Kineococcus sp. SYSU DK004]|uniref:DUF3427 domain-containing protein n=1 Tax=Kineococcus sp. SYSU DK004 TaxID=3383125 RepID=UPI003D7DB79A